MKGLFLKDLFLSFRGSKAVSMFMIMCVFLAFSSSGAFIIAYAALLMGTIAVGTISYDEFDNGFPFLLSLPVSKRTYVAEKFLYVILAQLAGLIMGVAVYTVASMIRGVPAGLAEGLPVIAAMYLLLVIMITSMIPVQLKFGSEKSRIVLMIIGGVMAAVMVGLSGLAGSVPGGLQNMIDTVSRIPGVLILLIGILLTAGVETLLYLTAVKVMERKEF